MVGIIQAQHPDRASLFMQWKQMGWPIMIDALNELEVAVVPITMFIDEHGIIRALRPPRRRITEVVQRTVSSTAPSTSPGSELSVFHSPGLSRKHWMPPVIALPVGAFPATTSSK